MRRQVQLIQALPAKQMVVIYQQYNLATNKMKNLSNRSYYIGTLGLNEGSTIRGPRINFDLFA